MPRPLRAASMSSSGTVWRRYCVIQNTPNALVSAGTMIAPIWPVQPRSANRMYSGTTPSCVGTAIVATTKTSSHLPPGKRSFANAQPASVEKTTTDTAISVELKIEFQSASQKLTAGSLTTDSGVGDEVAAGQPRHVRVVDGRGIPRADQERPVVGEDRRDDDDAEADVHPERRRGRRGSWSSRLLGVAGVVRQVLLDDRRGAGC